jgi:hypothetical protein
MIELHTSVKQDDTTRTRTQKQGYLNLSNCSNMQSFNYNFPLVAF